MVQKLLLIIALFLLLNNSAWAIDFTQDANCQGAWLFTEGSGETVADASVNTNTGNFEAAGQPVWASATPPAAYVDYYVTFEAGTTDFISCGTNASLNVGAGDVSLVSWIRHANDGSDRLVCGKGKGGGGQKRYQTIVRGASGDVGNIEIDDDTDKDSVNGSTDIMTGAWVHLAGTVDRDSNNIVWVNGVNDGSGANDTDLSIDSGEAFKMGLEATSTFPWDGDMTEVAMFDDELTSTEINAIMDNGLKPEVVSGRGQLIMISKKP